MTSLLAVTVVVGVGAAALVSGSELGPSDAAPRAGDQAPTTSRLPQRQTRTAPTFKGASSLPMLEPGRLPGRLLHSHPGCRTVTLDLATFGAGEGQTGCLADVSAGGRFALLREAPDGPAHVVDLRSGRAASTRILLGPEPPPTLDDEGAVHRCSNGFRQTLRFGRATGTRRPGCLPVRLAGRVYLVPAPDRAPLQLEDATGRAFMLDPAAPPGAPPYVLAASPDGRFVAVASVDPEQGGLVGLYGARDGASVGRWIVGADTDVRALRVAHGGTAVAVLGRERGRAADGWQLFRPSAAAPVAGLAGERLLDASFSPDGRHVAVVTEARAAAVLDTARFVPLGRLPLGETVAVGWLPAPPG